MSAPPSSPAGAIKRGRCHVLRLPTLKAVSCQHCENVLQNSGDLTDQDLIGTHIERIALGQTNILITLKTGDATGNMIELARSRQPASPRTRIENDQNQSIEEPNISLVHAIARAHLWLKALSDGTYQSVEELADVAKWNSKVIRKVLRLAFLAPDITEAIIFGSQPKALGLSELQGISAQSWGEQRRLLGFTIRISPLWNISAGVSKASTPLNS